MNFHKRNRYGFYLMLSTILFCISYVLIIQLALHLTSFPFHYILSIDEVYYYTLTTGFLYLGVYLIKRGTWISLIIILSSCLCALFIICLNLNTYMWLLYLPVMGSLDHVYVTYLLQLLLPIIYIAYICIVLYCVYKIATKKAL